MLRSHAGAEMIMVQYKGNAPALNALMGGEVNLLFDVVNIAQGQVKSAACARSLRPTRSAAWVPSASSRAGETIPPISELVTWHGVMVPAATRGDRAAAEP